MEYEDRWLLLPGGRHRWLLFIAALGFGLLLVLPGLATPSRRTQTFAAETKVVVLDLVVSDRSRIRVGIRDGTTAKVTPLGGKRLEVVPKMSGDSLDLEVYETAVASETGLLTREVVARLHLDRGATVTFDAGAVSIGVVWVDMRIAPARSADAENCSECCITCLGVRFCACLVESPCGKCCCGECCAIGGNPNCGAAGSFPGVSCEGAPRRHP